MLDRYYRPYTSTGDLAAGRGLEAAAHLLRRRRLPSDPSTPRRAR
jgi:hypothetical protein